MEKQAKTTREMIAAAYRETELWSRGGYGEARIMMDRCDGRIWTDLFAGHGNQKVYHDGSIIPVPVKDVIWEETGDRPLTQDECVDAIYRWYETQLFHDDRSDCRTQESNRIEIRCAGGVSLVAERNEDNNYNEIFIGLEKDGVWIQDLAVARQAYTYQKQSTFPVHTAGEYEVFVWKNEDSEDCTHEIRIMQRKDTEESICSTEGYGIRQR